MEKIGSCARMDDYLDFGCSANFNCPGPHYAIKTSSLSVGCNLCRGGHWWNSQAPSMEPNTYCLQHRGRYGTDHHQCTRVHAGRQAWPFPQQWRAWRCSPFHWLFHCHKILPLLMECMLKDQEWHLLVKVIDWVLYKLDDLVQPYVHKILIVIEPLFIDEDYYTHIEGCEIIFNLSKAAGLAHMISTMRPDVDHADEYVRNTMAMHSPLSPQRLVSHPSSHSSRPFAEVKNYGRHVTLVFESSNKLL